MRHPLACQELIHSGCSAACRLVLSVGHELTREVIGKRAHLGPLTREFWEVVCVDGHTIATAASWVELQEMLSVQIHERPGVAARLALVRTSSPRRSPMSIAVPSLGQSGGVLTAAMNLLADGGRRLLTVEPAVTVGIVTSVVTGLTALAPLPKPAKAILGPLIGTVTPVVANLILSGLVSPARSAEPL